MASFSKLSKGLVVAATVLTISMGVSAQASAKPNPELVTLMQDAVTTQVTRMSGEMTKQLEASIVDSLSELGLSSLVESTLTITTDETDKDIQTVSSRVLRTDNK